MTIEHQQFDDMISAAHALADELAIVLRNAIDQRGNALIAVSGGRTPEHVFKRLRQQRLDWQKVTVTLTDERWVPADHPDSNEKLVRTHLLQDAAAAAAFVPLFGGEATPEAGQSACEARLQKLNVPFDAVYLGMGGDGHFASLFPGDAAVNVTEGLCIAAPETVSRVARMSLTAPAVLNARKIFLLFSGADKHAKYAEAQQPGVPSEVPLRLVLRQSQTPVTVLSAQ